MGRPNLPPPLPLLLLPLFWHGAHPVTKLPSLRQLMPGNGRLKVSIREEKNKDNSNDNVIYDNVYRRRQIKSAKIQLSRPYKYLTLKP